MPEAEDVITDAARHATVFAQELWRRNRRNDARAPIDWPQLLQRVDLFVTAAFERSFRFRIAQPPAPRTFARKLLRRHEAPAAAVAVPATDGVSIWLPTGCGADDATAIAHLRVMALQQAARAVRGAPQTLPQEGLQRAIYEVLAAHEADVYLTQRFAGLHATINEFRREALARRPQLQSFPSVRQPLEAWVRSVMAPFSADAALPAASLREEAHALAMQLQRRINAPASVASLLFRDAWIGELRAPTQSATDSIQSTPLSDESTVQSAAARSARLTRRPNVREADERDERAGQGAWMVQTTAPHEHAEDPFGLQRPTDRDEDTPAEGFADSLAELAEARLVSTPGAPKEVLISEDPPETRTRAEAKPSTTSRVFSYPEWDWRARAYRTPGAAVHVLDPPLGSREWVRRTLAEHDALLRDVRRQFEALRAQPLHLRQQDEGDELDLEACIDAFADAHASGALDPGLYRSTRMRRRELAMLLLIDVSGSTDSWIAQHRRVIDVEREALLIVCLALETLGEPYSVLAFSGEGPARVTTRSIKTFAESYGDEIALRISGLEPERYTRAGAAIRHASSLLMREAARHRLLLILSDGKPNDVDEYDGRYGVEDMRQAVIEARLQGISSFCLTIDRQTANYLPAVFGEGQYSLLHRPELLTRALLGWLRRLIR